MMSMAPAAACGIGRTGSVSSRLGLGLDLRVLLEARHDFEETAWPVAIVELSLEDAPPGVLAGAGRAWDAEYQRAAGEPAAGARLHRRGADALVAQLME